MAFIKQIKSNLHKMGILLVATFCMVSGQNCSEGFRAPLVGQSSQNSNSNSPANTQSPSVTHPTNMLANGDFSYGLQCYEGWVWSNVAEYKGDFRVYLSSDAHSAPWSAEIKCNGSDCVKATIKSGDIPVTPGKSYNLELYTKCQPGGGGFVYLPGTVDGDVAKNLTCTGSWTNSQFQVTPATGAKTFSFAIYNNKPISLFVDDIQLTYSDGTVPEQKTVHAGIRNVSISGSTVKIDESPYLALGFYSVSQENFGKVADLGANVIANLGGNTIMDCFATDAPNALDNAFELGLNVLPDTTFSARLSEPAVYPKIAGRFGSHLANIGWYLVDEPDMPTVPFYIITPEKLISEYQSLKSYSTLPIMADFQGGAWQPASSESPYAPAVDIFMAEPYGSDFGSLKYAADLYKGIANKPMWFAQDTDIDASLYVAKGYWAIVNGVTGILYFTWESVKSDTSKVAAITQLFKELTSLKPAIFAQSASVTSSSGITAMARHYQNQTYILAVNPGTTSVSGTFQVPGLTSGTVITVQFENRSIVAGNGTFIDNFPGPSRHVYIIQMP